MTVSLAAGFFLISLPFILFSLLLLWSPLLVSFTFDRSSAGASAIPPEGMACGRRSFLEEWPRLTVKTKKGGHEEPIQPFIEIQTILQKVVGVIAKHFIRVFTR